MLYFLCRIFDTKGLMRESKKADLGKSLKDLTHPLSRSTTLKKVIDGGWFLHHLKRNEKDTWGIIIDNYVDLAISWSNKPIEESSTQEVKAKDITVVFDGINSSPKDQEHIRRCNHLSGNITINEDLPHIIPREKFLDNAFNKNNLIVAVVEKMKERGIKSIQCIQYPIQFRRRTFSTSTE